MRQRILLSFVALFIGIALLLNAQSATASLMVFTNDSFNDASGDPRCEMFAIGSTIENGRLYFEIRTNTPPSGFWGNDSHAYTLLTPGDVYIGVGSTNPFDFAAHIYGIGATDHDNCVEQAYPGETWVNVVTGRLYANATFATGTYEDYQAAVSSATPDDYDGSSHINSYPTFIKSGTEISGHSSLTWFTAGAPDPWAYKATGWVDTSAINLQPGMDYSMFYSLECGNDGMSHSATAPAAPPIPEPAGLALCAIAGVLCVTRRRFDRRT